MNEDGATCSPCKRPLIEIDHYGEKLTGCVVCNRWAWPDNDDLITRLPEEDIHALQRARGFEGEA